MLDTPSVPKSGGSGTTGSGSGGSGSGGTETNTSWNTTLDGIRAHLNIPAQHGLPGGKGAATKICGICYGESKTGDDRTRTAMCANAQPWANTCTNYGGVVSNAGYVDDRSKYPNTYVRLLSICYVNPQYHPTCPSVPDFVNMDP